MLEQIEVINQNYTRLFYSNNKMLSSVYVNSDLFLARMLKSLCNTVPFFQLGVETTLFNNKMAWGEGQFLINAPMLETIIGLSSSDCFLCK